MLYHRRSLLDELTAKGIRLTNQRRLLVEIIQNAEVHLDAATLLELAQQTDPGIDRATIYRTIELLKKHGLIDELDLMHLKGETLLRSQDSPRSRPSGVFRMRPDRRIFQRLFERLKAEISAQTGFEVKVARLELGGRCRYCGAAAKQ